MIKGTNDEHMQTGGTYQSVVHFEQGSNACWFQSIYTHCREFGCPLSPKWSAFQ